MEHPFLSSEQLQNYAGTFLLSCASSLFVIFWCYFFIRPPNTADLIEDPKDMQNYDKYSDTASTHSFEASMNMSPFPPNITTSAEDLVKAVEEETVDEAVSHYDPLPDELWPKLKDMFGLKNLKKVWTTAFKMRPGTVRKRMWIIVVTINLTLLPDFGKVAVIFPMVEKVYGWDATTYSNLVTVRYLLQMGIVLFALPFIFKLFTLNDIQTAMVGIMSGILGDVTIGSWTQPMGFYLWGVIGSLNGIAGTGCRAYISKLLPKSDVSQIFSVVLMIEAIAQCFGTYLFVFLFRETIHSYATFVFHFMGFILVFSLCCLVYVDLTTPYEKNVKARALSKGKIHPLQAVDTNIANH
jgi:hypothetical protein